MPKMEKQKTMLISIVSKPIKVVVMVVVIVVVKKKLGPNTFDPKNLVKKL